jgi:diguanylate cyclase (GGDEF)-like protein
VLVTWIRKLQRSREPSQSKSADSIELWSQPWWVDHKLYGILLTLGFLNLSASLLLGLARPSHGEPLELLSALASLLAASACLHRGFRGPHETKNIWNLVAVGLLLWTVGHVGCSISGGVAEVAERLPSKWNFFRLVYAIPIVLATSSANGDVGLRSFLWLDGMIAGLTVALAYAQPFLAVPEWGRLEPLSSGNLVHVYVIQAVVLACVCTVRLLCSSPGETRNVYSALSGFVWIYVLVSVLLGSPKAGAGPVATYREVLWQVPFILLLGALALWPQSHAPIAVDRIGASTADFLVDNLSPLSLTTATVLLASAIQKKHFILEVLSLTAAMALLGFRTAIRQRDYVRSHLRVERSHQELIQANAQLSQLALRDGLTGAYNRRHFNQMLGEEWRRAKRSKQPLSLIMIDVDHFKSLNDRYGHPTGDAVLRAIVRSLTTSLRRPGDLLARYGGEEFAVILAGVDLEGALVVAEHMRASVEERQIPNYDQDTLRVVTLSIGVVTEQAAEEGSPQGMLDRVDAALYRAKSEGRNRICN